MNAHELWTGRDVRVEIRVGTPHFSLSRSQGHPAFAELRILPKVVQRACRSSVRPRSPRLGMPAASSAFGTPENGFEVSRSVRRHLLQKTMSEARCVLRDRADRFFKTSRASLSSKTPRRSSARRAKLESAGSRLRYASTLCQCKRTEPAAARALKNVFDSSRIRSDPSFHQITGAVRNLPLPSRHCACHSPFSDNELGPIGHGSSHHLSENAAHPLPLLVVFEVSRSGLTQLDRPPTRTVELPEHPFTYIHATASHSRSGDVGCRRAGPELLTLVLHSAVREKRGFEDGPLVPTKEAERSGQVVRLDQLYKRNSDMFLRLRLTLRLRASSLL